MRNGTGLRRTHIRLVGVVRLIIETGFFTSEFLYHLWKYPSSDSIHLRRRCHPSPLSIFLKQPSLPGAGPHLVKNIRKYDATVAQ